MIAEENILRKIEIDDYMEEVILSKARRPKYYSHKHKKDLPKKYITALEKG
jgi:hypothetical protein